MENADQNTTTTKSENNNSDRASTVISYLLKVNTDSLIEQISLDGENLPEPQNVSGKKYSGLNALILMNEEIAKNYTSSEWATFKQWKEQNRSIRKGEIGSMIFYFTTNLEDDNGEIKKRTDYNYRYVFNRCQLSEQEPS